VLSCFTAMMRDIPALRTVFQAALDALPAPERFPEASDSAVARRLAERLRRDLLPRMNDGDTPVLLVAITGPNNVGKSTLFNALVDAPLSPARPEGGLTKQCLAVAHPKVWTSELRDFLTRRYDVVEVPSTQAAPVDQPGPPGRLYLALSETVMPGLVVIDTPDFDSVYRENRERAEALLVTVDVLAFMVSQPTYQNAALVDFLRLVVGRSRPYFLIYNDAYDELVALEHMERLAMKVRAPPLGRYVAYRQPRVEAGKQPLVTFPMNHAPPLEKLLGDPTMMRGIKQQAMEASLLEARDEMQQLGRAARAVLQQPERLRQRLRHELLALGTRAALKALPADVLVDAFRDELDARSAFHRYMRLPFRGLATALTSLGRKVRGSFTGPQPQPPPLSHLAEDTLRDGVRQLVEVFAPEVAAWQGDARTRELLAASFGPPTLDGLEQPLGLEDLHAYARDRSTLYAYCRDLMSAQLRGGLPEGVLQTLTTLAYSVPAGAAAMVTVVSGGFGQDAVIWAGTLLSTPLLERFADQLGERLRETIILKWAQTHGATLAQVLEQRFFAELLSHLDAEVEYWSRAASALSTYIPGVPEAGPRPSTFRALLGR
jgi:hypothetical protein